MDTAANEIRFSRVAVAREKQSAADFPECPLGVGCLLLQKARRPRGSIRKASLILQTGFDERMEQWKD
jgi:hypothetical protein